MCVRLKAMERFKGRNVFFTYLLRGIRNFLAHNFSRNILHAWHRTHGNRITSIYSLCILICVNISSITYLNTCNGEGLGPRLRMDY